MVSKDRFCKGRFYYPRRSSHTSTRYLPGTNPHIEAIHRDGYISKTKNCFYVHEFFKYPTENQQS